MNVSSLINNVKKCLNLRACALKHIILILLIMHMKFLERFAYNILSSIFYGDIIKLKRFRELEWSVLILGNLALIFFSQSVLI